MNLRFSQFLRTVFISPLIEPEESKVIKELKRFETFCLSFNILPNGWSQDQKVTPSKWTKIKSIIYSSLNAINIFHISVLCIFDLNNEWLLKLGDFFFDRPSRRYIWFFCLVGTVFAEAMRQSWIFLMKNDRLSKFKLYYSICLEGFTSSVLLMDEIYCHKFRFFLNILVTSWIRIILLIPISLGPTLILLVHSSTVPKSTEKFVYEYIWLIITYFGLICAIINICLTGALASIHLSYYFFRADYMAKNVQNLSMEKYNLTHCVYFLKHKVTVNEIIKFLNNIEKANKEIANWLIFLYFTITFVTNYGLYIAVFVHIDHGHLDFFLTCICAFGIFAIGSCSYANGIILVKVICFS